MKKLLFVCTTAFVGLTSGLSADQFYCNSAPCNPCVPCDPCDPCNDSKFEGFYVGGNLGIFTNTAHRNDYDGFQEDNSGWSTNNTGFTAGVQVGYDMQFSSNALVGFVADWNWIDVDSSMRIEPNDTGDNQRIRDNFDWFTTIRARAGVTVCDALIYVTGGAAVTEVKTRWNDAADEFRDSHTRWGWTGGVGTEFLLGCNFSIGAEVLFLQFSEHRRDFTAGADTYRFGHSDSAYVGRVILNYRFSDLFCCR